MKAVVRCFYENIAEIQAHVNYFKEQYSSVKFELKINSGDCVIRLSADNDKALEQCNCDLLTRLGHRVYSIDDAILPKIAVELLRLTTTTVATVESFTGGLVASSLVSVENCSEVFSEGYVSYSNIAKSKMAGVAPSLIDTHTAVSAEVAKAMADGILNSTKATYGVATTGYASQPQYGKEIPVGLCFVAIATIERTDVVKYEFEGNRNEIRRYGSNAALYQLVKRIKWPCDFENIYI